MLDYNHWDKIIIYINNFKTKYILKTEDIVSIFKKHSLNIIIEIVYVHLMKKIVEIVEILIYYSLKILD